MPVLRLILWLDEHDHADDALYVIRDARAGDNPPTEDADGADSEGSESSVLLGGQDVREVILACVVRRSVSRQIQR